jgi:flagellar assembly protein FliH
MSAHKRPGAAFEGTVPAADAVAEPLASRLRRVEGAGPPAWLSPPPASSMPRSAFTLEPGTGAASRRTPATPPSAADPVVEEASAFDADGVRIALEEALARAEHEGLQAAQAKIETLVERYLDGIERLAKVAEQAARPRAGDVVDLALAVAKELVGHELARDRERVVLVVEQALADVPNDTPVVVRLGRADAAYVRRRRPQLERPGVTIIEDDAIGTGGCFVETKEWLRDHTVAARLEAVRAKLVALLDDEPPAPSIAESEAA